MWNNLEHFQSMDYVYKIKKETGVVYLFTWNKIQIYTTVNASWSGMNKHFMFYIYILLTGTYPVIILNQ